MQFGVAPHCATVSLRTQSEKSPPPTGPLYPTLVRNVSFTRVHTLLSVRGLHSALSRYSLFMPNCGVPGSGMQGRGHTQPPTTANSSPASQLQDRVRRFASWKFQQRYRFCISELGRSAAAARSYRCCSLPISPDEPDHDMTVTREEPISLFHGASGLGVLAPISSTS